MNFKSKKLAPIAGAIQRAIELHNEGQHGEAVKACDWALGEARKLGVASAALSWHAAIAHDNAGNLEAAFDHIRRALELDPLAEPFRNSFGIIVGRIRAALTDEKRPADDPATPRLYDLLVRAGEADVACHAAMARYAAATGDLAKARALADALTLLFPASAEAWGCRSEVAAKAGDVATVEECARELAGLGEASVPFAIPGVAEA